MTTTTKNPAAVSLGTLGGRSTSTAKAAAAAANGKRGGRAPKGWFIRAAAGMYDYGKGEQTIGSDTTRAGALAAIRIHVAAEAGQ